MTNRKPISDLQGKSIARIVDIGGNVYALHDENGNILATVMQDGIFDGNGMHFMNNVPYEPSETE